MSKPSNKTKVTRISASDSPSSKKKVAEEASVTKIKAASTEQPKNVATKVATTRAPKKDANDKAPKAPIKVLRVAASPMRSSGSYLADSWRELKKVIWPDRQATWSMTIALILFSLFFVVLIMGLDALFKYLFELMLGK